MKIEGKASILKIYIGEADKLNGRPLYEEIVFTARKAGLAGATVYRGILSYGASHSIHTMKIFALSSDLPVILEIIDTAENLENFLPQLNKMIDDSKKGGLITMQEIDVIRYSQGEKYLHPTD
jgi:PII-like signaling protein